MYIGQIIFPTTRWYFYNVIEIEFTQTINSSSIQVIWKDKDFTT
jgi:hypothetical protein